MRLFIVPPALGCGWRIIATGARGRGPGAKRPSRRPSGPGKMTSGKLDLLNLGYAQCSARRWALYRQTPLLRNWNERLADRIYLDHAATTPMLPAAVAAVTEGMARWANP